MRKTTRTTAVAALTLLTASVHAQAPRGGPGGPPAGGPPGMAAQSQAWRKWDATHPNVRALQRMLGGLSRLEQDPHTRLKTPQAHAVLAVLTRWRSRPALSDAQARQVVQQIKAALTPAEVTQLTAERRGGRFSGPGGPGGPGGPPPPGGRFGGPPPNGVGGPPPGEGGPPRAGMRPPAPPTPHNFNPLNPSTSPFARSRSWEAQRLNALMTLLKKAP